MIYIQSEKIDRTVIEVIEWVRYLKHSGVHKLHGQPIVKDLTLRIEDKLDLQINSNKIDTQANYWYRRGKFKISAGSSKLFELKRMREIESLSRVLNRLGTIGNHENHNASRIYCFTIAHNLGLRVPPVILSNVKNDIIDFLKGTSRVVLKLDYIPLWYSSTENNNIYNTRENELFDSEEVISKLEQVGIFLPSLFIKYINKKFLFEWKV